VTRYHIVRSRKSAQQDDPLRHRPIPSLRTRTIPNELHRNSPFGLRLGGLQQVQLCHTVVSWGTQKGALHSPIGLLNLLYPSLPVAAPWLSQVIISHLSMIPSKRTCFQRRNLSCRNRHVCHIDLAQFLEAARSVSQG